MVSLFKSKNKPLYLSSSENGYIPLILTQESNAACGKIIFLLCFSCSKIKDTVPYPISSLQNSMYTFRNTQMLKKKKENVMSLVISNNYLPNFDCSAHISKSIPTGTFYSTMLHEGDKTRANCPKPLYSVYVLHKY